jgi:hypothetical protein
LLFHKFADGDSGDYACECGLEYSIRDREVIEASFNAETAEIAEIATEAAFA